MTPEERGNVKAIRRESPHRDPQGPTQVSVVQFGLTQM